MNWSTLFSHALLYGSGLTLAMLALMLTSGALALDMWVGDYPPDIQQKYGPMSPRAARLRPWFAIAVFAAFLGIPMLGLFALQARLGSVPFLPAFAFASAALLFFNIFDLLVLDWLLFCTVQPRMMVLPGTEGMAGYRDYRFHFVGFLKGLGFCFVGGLLIACGWTGLQALLA